MEVIIGKVVNWVNTSIPIEGEGEFKLNKIPKVSVLIIKIKNGQVAVIEPVYNCNNTKRYF